jgi:release factor glutamine methyltransferase
MPTIKELLDSARRRLSDTSLTPDLDARILLEQTTGCSRVDAVARPDRVIPETQAAIFLHSVERRASGEPIAYITGTKEFYGRIFMVSPAVLIPRPDTEILIERALELAGSARTILDLGTGSGCIAITLALELRESGADARILALDKSFAALETAQQNAAALAAAELVEFRESDWFSAIKAGERFDCIVSNPPYVSRTDERLSPETRFEPQAALFAEADGLACLRVLFEEAWRFLTPSGVLFLEMGSEQRSALESLYRSRGWDRHYEPLQFFTDLGGRDRVVFTRRKVDGRATDIRETDTCKR